MAAVPHTSSALPAGRQLPLLRLLKAGPDSQVGTPVRVFMLVILLAAVGAGLGLFVLAPAAPIAEPKVIVPFKDRKKAGAAAPAQAAVVPKPATATAAPPAKAAAPPAAKAVPAPKAAAVPAPPKPDDGLPAKLSAALDANRVVVASLYAPDSSVAVMARGEAEAGAKAAGVGFVALNVYVPAEIDELAAKLGVLSDPTVLVFTRGGEVAARFTGFADRELVAQAAASSARK